MVIWVVPIWVQVALFAAVVLFLLIHLEAAGPLHPAVWFSVFLFLYSVNYPLFLLTYGEPHTESSLILPLSFLALTGFLLGQVMTSKKPITAPAIPLSAGALRTIILALLPICIALILLVFALGSDSKREFIDTTRQLGIAPLFIFFHMITVAYIVYALRLSQTSGAGRGLRHSFFTMLGIIVLGMLFLNIGVTGERDLFLRAGLLVYLSLMALGRGPTYRFWHFILIGFAGVYLVNVLQGLKGVLLDSGSDAVIGQIQSVFWNEFASAGRNLDYLLSKNIEPLYGDTYVWAVMRYFDFLFPDAMSATQWYNSILRNDFGDGGTSGWGFSLVAEAYLNFGSVGIFVVFFLIGLLTAALYRGARRSAFGFLFYLLFVPTLIYVLRADVGNLLALAFKINLALVGGIWLLAMSIKIYAGRPKQPVVVAAGDT